MAAEGFSSPENQGDVKRNLTLKFPDMMNTQKAVSLASMGHPTQMTYVRESRTRMQVKAALWGDLRWRSAERATAARRTETPERNSLQRRSQTPERLMSSKFRTQSATERPTLSLLNSRELPDTHSQSSERQSRPLVRQSPTQIQGRLLSDLKLQQKRVDPPDRPELRDSKPQTSSEMREHFQLELNSGASSAEQQQVDDLEPVWQLRSEQPEKDTGLIEKESHNISDQFELYETSLDSFNSSLDNDSRDENSHLNKAAMQTGVQLQAQEQPRSLDPPQNHKHMPEQSSKTLDHYAPSHTEGEKTNELLGNGSLKLYMRSSSEHMKCEPSHSQAGSSIHRFVADLQQDDQLIRPRSNSAVGYSAVKLFPCMANSDRSFTADNILKLKQRNEFSGSVLTSPDSDLGSQHMSPLSSRVLSRQNSQGSSHEQPLTGVSNGVLPPEPLQKPVAPKRTSLLTHARVNDDLCNADNELSSVNVQHSFLRRSQTPERFRPLDAMCRRGSAPDYPALLKRSQSPDPSEIPQRPSVLAQNFKSKTSEVEELASINAMRPIPPARPSLLYRSATPDLISTMQHLDVSMRRNSVPERPSGLSVALKSSSLKNLNSGYSSPPVQRKYSVPRPHLPLADSESARNRSIGQMEDNRSSLTGEQIVGASTSLKCVQRKISVTDHPLVIGKEGESGEESHPLSDHHDVEAETGDDSLIGTSDGTCLEQTDMKQSITEAESSGQMPPTKGQQIKESSGIGAAIKRSHFFNCFQKYDSAQTPEYGCAPDDAQKYEVPKSDENVPSTVGTKTSATVADQHLMYTASVKATPQSQRRQSEHNRASAETAEISQPSMCHKSEAADQNVDDSVSKPPGKTADTSKKPESPRRQSRTCTPDRRSLFRACVGRSDTTSPVESQYDLISSTGQATLQPPRQVLRKQPVAQESMQLVVRHSGSSSRPSQIHPSVASRAGHAKKCDTTAVCLQPQPPKEAVPALEEVCSERTEQKKEGRPDFNVKMSPVPTERKSKFSIPVSRPRKPIDLFAPAAHGPSGPASIMSDLPMQQVSQKSSKFEFKLPVSNLSHPPQMGVARPELSFDRPAQRPSTNMLAVDSRPSPSEMKEYFQMDLNQPKSSAEEMLENMPFQFTPRAQRSRSPERTPFQMVPQQTRPDRAECGFSQMSSRLGRDPSPGSSRWRERLRSQSLENTGKLQISPDRTFDFTAEDLMDQGEIGRGAYGTVNKMYHEQSGTLMAVKRIRSTVDEKEQKQLLMDLDVVMRSADCPYIVQFYGALFKEGDCWICMEVMSISLDKFYKYVYHVCNDRIPEDIIGRVTVATLKALSYLKDKLKIIHRDVKPSNILLDRNGNIKLCDFGISGQLIDSIAKTRDAGCRPYMAPERIDPRASGRGYDVRSDVWSLGITLIELSTGKFPYPKWNSVFDQLTQVVQGDPPNLREHDERFSPEFILFVNTCMTKDQEARPKYAKLLRLPFIRKYEETEVDVAAYVSSILDSMPQDRSELDVLIQNSS